MAKTRVTWSRWLKARPEFVRLVSELRDVNELVALRRDITLEPAFVPGVVRDAHRLIEKRLSELEQQA